MMTESGYSAEPIFDAFAALTSLPIEQRWRSQVAPAPIVAALIRRPGRAAGQDEFLLINRNSEPYRGYWALVGGKWEFGEPLSTAVEREVAEESGLRSTFVAVRALVGERMLAPGAVSQAAHFLILLCEVHVDGGHASQQSEGDVRWFGRSELDELHAGGRIVPSDYAMMREFSNADVVLPYVEARLIGSAAGQPEQPLRLLGFDQH